MLTYDMLLFYPIVDEALLYSNFVIYIKKIKIRILCDGFKKVIQNLFWIIILNLFNFSYYI